MTKPTRSTIGRAATRPDTTKLWNKCRIIWNQTHCPNIQLIGCCWWAVITQKQNSSRQRVYLILSFVKGGMEGDIWILPLVKLNIFHIFAGAADNHQPAQERAGIDDGWLQSSPNAAVHRPSSYLRFPRNLQAKQQHLSGTTNDLRTFELGGNLLSELCWWDVSWDQ